MVRIHHPLPGSYAGRVSDGDPGSHHHARLWTPTSVSPLPPLRCLEPCAQGLTRSPISPFPVHQGEQSTYLQRLHHASLQFSHAGKQQSCTAEPECRSVIDFLGLSSRNVKFAGCGTQCWRLRTLDIILSQGDASEGSTATNHTHATHHGSPTRILVRAAGERLGPVGWAR